MTYADVLLFSSSISSPDHHLAVAGIEVVDRLAVLDVRSMKREALFPGNPQGAERPEGRQFCF